MDKTTIRRIANFMAKCLEERGVSVSQIILFGSQADGTAHDESDIDIAVISHDFHRKNIFRRAEMLGDAELRTIRKFMAPMDVVTMSPQDLENGKSPVAGFVRQGKVIYPHGVSGERKTKAATR